MKKKSLEDAQKLNILWGCNF